MPFLDKHALAETRRDQRSTICSGELGGLHQHTDEVQGRKVGFVGDLVEPERLILIDTGPLDDLAHPGDHGAGQITLRGQRQSTPIGGTSEHE